MPADARPAPIELGTWPTPVEPAPGLAAAVGLAADTLWIKRDDLTGLGGGGNKLRKLRALAGLAALVADGRIKPGDRTVFEHTGGLPGLFGHPGLPYLT